MQYHYRPRRKSATKAGHQSNNGFHLMTLVSVGAVTKELVRDAIVGLAK